MTKVDIVPEKNEYHDNFLDIIGQDFKFDHAKGLAEWIKNSADAYATTAKAQDAEQFILLRFEIRNPKKFSVFECIDFVGMKENDITKALKVWGNPEAAKKGTDQATYGGHGNGGKFYMRQMFKVSRYVTYRDGLLNVFGFDEKRRYGFANDAKGKSLRNLKLTPEEALKFAGIQGIEIPEAVQSRWKKHGPGFTVVVGEGPEKFSGRSTIESVLEKLRVHPQARRLIAHKQVVAMGRGDKWGKRIELPVITPMAGFENIRPIELPKEFTYREQVFEFRNSKYPEAKLTLRTSDQPFSRGSELEVMNGIDILGKVGCVGSYRMNELGVFRFAQEADFIYGECECPLLEDPEHNSVTNDRDKLADNELTRALRAWITQQVEGLAERMSSKRRTEQKQRDLEKSSLFIAMLDKWKNRFMVKLSGMLFGGKDSGDTFGGFGQGNGGLGSEGDAGVRTGEEKNGSKDGENKGAGGGAGTEQRRGPKMPRVLLSGRDMDPLDPNATEPYICSDRHPPVHQRDVDIAEGIFWINTAKPLAGKILSHDGAESVRWREYLFQRFVDIILKQQIHQLGKNDPQLTADKIDNLMDKVTSSVHDQAAQDLEAFLFDDTLKAAAAAPGSEEPVPQPDEAPVSR